MDENMTTHSHTAEDAQLPLRLVELRELKTRAGDPFRVWCEFVPEELLLSIVQGIPGLTVDGAANETDDEVTQKVRKWLSWAPGIIEAGTFLQRLDGTIVRPAFFFGDTPVAGSVPGRYLSAKDRSLLIATIMDLSGWGGGAAEKLRFHGRDGAGGGGGARAVDAGQGDGNATERPAGDGLAAADAAPVGGHDGDAGRAGAATSTA